MDWFQLKETYKYTLTVYLIWYLFNLVFIQFLVLQFGIYSIRHTYSDRKKHASLCRGTPSTQQGPGRGRGVTEAKVAL